MRHSIKTGISFGLTSGIITVLGLMVGLYSSTHSKMIVLSAILIIAIADALSDASGIHVSEEAENIHSAREIWESTFATFFSKFFVSITFAAPLLLFSLSTAIIVSVAWGLLLLGVFSFIMAKKQGRNPHKVIAEHLCIAAVVIVITNYLGQWLKV